MRTSDRGAKPTPTRPAHATALARLPVPVPPSPADRAPGPNMRQPAQRCCAACLHGRRAASPGPAANPSTHGCCAPFINNRIHQPTTRPTKAAALDTPSRLSPNATRIRPAATRDRHASSATTARPQLAGRRESDKCDGMEQPSSASVPPPALSLIGLICDNAQYICACHHPKQEASLGGNYGGICR